MHVVTDMSAFAAKKGVFMTFPTIRFTENRLSANRFTRTQILDKVLKNEDLSKIY